MEDTLKKQVLTGQASRSQTARLRRRRDDLQLSSLQRPGNIFARPASYFSKTRRATYRQGGHFNLG